MKNNVLSAANCLTGDTVWFDRLSMQIRKKIGQKIDPCGTPKKTKNLLFLFLAEVNILQRILFRCNFCYKHFIYKHQ